MEEISARLALMSGMGLENLHDPGASEKGGITSRKGEASLDKSFQRKFDALSWKLSVQFSSGLIVHLFLQKQTTSIPEDNRWTTTAWLPCREKRVFEA